MGNRVDETCVLVVAERTVFPLPVRQAAVRLIDFFGDRRFGSIGRDDFSAYVGKCASDDGLVGIRGCGTPMERAGFDLRVLGTLAGFAGEMALWELIQTWTEENCVAIAGARP